MKNFSANTRQEMQSTIESLPEELQEEILHLHLLPLNGKDLNPFKEAFLVSHAWSRLVQNLSRDLLRRYFPYFVVTQPQHFTDAGYQLLPEIPSSHFDLQKGIIYLSQNRLNQLEYKVITPQNRVATGVLSTIQNRDEALTLEKLAELKPQIMQEIFAKGHTSANTPLRLLVEECQRYQKWFSFIDIAFVLAALEGERETIAAVEDENIKNTLYALFFANGHMTSLAEFKDKDRYRIRGDAFKYAAYNGHVETIKTHLKKVGEQISVLNKGAALWDAAINGHIKIVNILLKKTGAQISIEQKILALRGAVTNGHVEIAHILFEEVSGQLSDFTKGQMFWNAANNGHIEIVNTFLEEIGAQISADDKGKALWHAAQHGHAEIVKLLLKKVGAQISIENKDLAMHSATFYHHLEIVYLLLCYQAKEALIKDLKKDEIKDNRSQNQRVRSFYTILRAIFNAATYRPSLTVGVGCALMGFLVLGLPSVACLFILMSMTLGVEIIKKLARNAGERALRNEKHLEDAQLKPFIQKGKISELSWKNYCLDTLAMPSSMFPAFLSKKSEAYQKGRAMARKEKAYYEMKARKRRCR